MKCYTIINLAQEKVQIGVVRQKRKGYTLLHEAIKSLPEGLLVRGQLIDREKLLMLLEEWLLELPVRSQKVYLLVASCEVIRWEVKVPQKVSRHLGQFIRNEDRNYLPAGLKDYSVTYTKVEPAFKEATEDTFHLVATPQKLLEDFATLFKKVGQKWVYLSTEAEMMTPVLAQQTNMTYYVVCAEKSWGFEVWFCKGARCLLVQKIIREQGYSKLEGWDLQKMVDCVEEKHEDFKLEGLYFLWQKEACESLGEEICTFLEVPQLGHLKREEEATLYEWLLKSRRFKGKEKYEFTTTPVYTKSFL